MPFKDEEERKEYGRHYVKATLKEREAYNKQRYNENLERERAKRREHYAKHKEQILPRINRDQRRYHRQWRMMVISHYGAKCACCGESHIEFLCIDHINGGGNKHRKSLHLGVSAGWHFYRWLIVNGYPDGYRVLCHNCNSSLGHYGYCPHTKELLALMPILAIQ